MNEKIFLLEDDAYLRDGLCEMLKNQSYDVVCEESIAGAKQILYNNTFDLIILDVMLPDGYSYDLCKQLRFDNIITPILFLTACDDEMQVVKGLDSGADDYVTKPFKLLELLSRIRALLRRNICKSSQIIKNNDIVIDTNNMTVKKGDKLVFVTKTEFQILNCLIRNSGVIVTRDTLLSNIWDDDGNYVYDNTLSVHISRLREKIGNEHIITVRGIGYRWEDADA